LLTDQGKVFAEKYLTEKPVESVDCLVCGSEAHRLWYQMGYFNSLICEVCGCRYVSSRYDDEQLSAFYSKALFTESKDYEGACHNMLDPKERARKRFDMKEEVEATMAHCHAGGRVLDVGCQTGIYLESLPENIEKFGVERSTWAADHTRKITGSEVITAKVEDAEYPDEFFDVINMSYVVEHFQRPVQTLTVITGWLKKSGRLIVSVPNFDSICARLFKEFYRLADPRQHIFLTTMDSLKGIFRPLGMHIEKVYYPYFGTPYCSVRQQIRLVSNALRIRMLPLKLRAGRPPHVSKLISPPFYGNIMTIVWDKG
jgi:2-polyprenyl-3-methyl-5-hydroxy-6-metoxy-1,4-benzoquinol methylase